MKAIDDVGAPPRGTPKNYLVAWLLVLLKRSPRCGYEIVKQLRDDVGLPAQPAAVYRTLRMLEAGGLIHSHWNARDPEHGHGHERRVYELTAAGEGALRAWSDALGEYRASLEKFFHVYHAIESA